MQQFHTLSYVGPTPTPATINDNTGIIKPVQNKLESVQVFIGGSGRCRTCDAWLFGPALYHLSYRSIWWADLDLNQECLAATDLQSAALPIPLIDPYVGGVRAARTPRSIAASLP